MPSTTTIAAARAPSSTTTDSRSGNCCRSAFREREYGKLFHRRRLGADDHQFVLNRPDSRLELDEHLGEALVLFGSDFTTQDRCAAINLHRDAVESRLLNFLHPRPKSCRHLL